MFSLFLKVVSLAKVGLVTFGLTSPLTWVTASSPYWEKVWRTYLSYTGPILDCSDHQGEYKVFLNLETTGNGTEGAIVTFKVVDSKNKKTVWDTKAVGGDRWSYFSFKSEGEKIKKLWHPTNDSSGSSFEANDCQVYKLDLVELSSGGGYQEPIKVSDIDLKLVDSKSCTQNFSTVECDIALPTDKKLKWIDKFKPKVIFSAF